MAFSRWVRTTRWLLLDFSRDLALRWELATNSVTFALGLGVEAVDFALVRLEDLAEVAAVLLRAAARLLLPS